MFGGFRDEKSGPWIVVGGLLGLALLLLFIGLLWSQTYEAVYHDYAASKAQADAQDIFDRVCAKLTTIEDVLNCTKEAVKSARETQRSEEDVYAQKQMAQWAWWLLIFTTLIGVVSVGITGGGTYLLLRTVRLSGEANAVAREIGQAEVRAYLTCSEGSLFAEQGKLRLQLVLSNKGKSPAKNIRVGGQIYAAHSSAVTDANKWRTQMQTTIQIGTCSLIPIDDHDNVSLVWFDNEIDKAILGAMLHSSVIVRSYCTVAWDDVFRESQSIHIVMDPKSVFVAHNPRSKSWKLSGRIDNEKQH